MITFYYDTVDFIKICGKTCAFIIKTQKAGGWKRDFHETQTMFSLAE